MAAPCHLGQCYPKIYRTFHEVGRCRSPLVASSTVSDSSATAVATAPEWSSTTASGCSSPTASAKLVCCPVTNEGVLSTWSDADGFCQDAAFGGSALPD